MRAALYRPFDDPWRQSMRVYAAQLQKHLVQLAGPADAIAAVALPDARLSPPARYWDQYVRYQRLAARTAADVHHILDHGFAHLAGALPPNRAVVTFHDAMPLRMGASFWARKALETGMRSALARGARFIVPSEASRRDAVDLFEVPETAIAVIAQGVDERFRPSGARETLRREFALARPVVLIVGHTYPYMNVETTLRAAAIARRSVDLDVVKIGPPLTLEHGALVASLGLSDRFRELGIVSDEKLAAWYAAADALVYLPSVSGFGLPVIEAMASGLPAVASNTGAVAEIAGGAAATVDPLNAQAAAGALTALLTDDGHRSAVVAKGFVRARAFSWRETAAATLAVYRRVIDAA